MGKEVLNLQRLSGTGIFTRQRRDNTWTNAAKMGQEEWCEMYVRPFHRELSLVGMRQFGAGNFCLLL